jgi:hypothetical protein
MQRVLRPPDTLSIFPARCHSGVAMLFHGIANGAVAHIDARSRTELAAQPVLALRWWPVGATRAELPSHTLPCRQRMPSNITDSEDF